MLLNLVRESLSGQNAWRRNRKKWILVIQLADTEAHLDPPLCNPNPQEQSTESEREFMEVCNGACLNICTFGLLLFVYSAVTM